MSQEQAQGEGLVVVFRAPNEYIADMLVGLLVGEGIPAILQSKMVPWMNGIMLPDAGYWGDVVVPQECAERSTELIEEFMSSGNNQEPEEDTMEE